ncbi:MAG: ABC transporter permease [Clostridia bacterium]|nr:ABC transporter permease [Clostridia bacterium]
MTVHSLPFKNIRHKPSRTAALAVIVFLMAFTLLGGTLSVLSLQRGLAALETRLGADIIVVPDTAKSKMNLENIVLQGIPGYFYMDKECVDKIAQVEGVEQVSAQYYLASVSSGCCSMPVQIIGFDPETDFSVTPWIRQSYGETLGTLDVVVGCNINKLVGGTLKFYGLECNVVAKLDRTGTELDNAVYGNVDTVKKLIAASVEKGLNELAKKDPDKIVSSVLIKVKDGYNIDDVTDYINVYVRHVQAVRTKSMLTGVADSLGGVSNVIQILIAAVWVFVLILLFVVFSAMINERKREFAVYRVMGTSKSMLAKMVLTESTVLSFSGSVLGCAAAVLCVSSFSTVIENQLQLPFLLPDFGTAAICGLITLAASVVISSVAAFYAAIKLSRVDAGLILREGN